MTTTDTLREFRLLPMGDAKERTNYDSGIVTPEDDLVGYDSE